jgi:PmbA protein
MSTTLDKTINDDSLKSLLSQAIEYASANGADQVEVAASNDKGYSVTARLGEVETVEHHNQRAMGVTVYRGKAKGSASTNIVTPEAINRTIDSALEIAKFTAEDKCSGLADAELMANDYPQLDLDHPWSIEPEQALQQAILCEEVARDDKRIVNSEGASVSSISTQLSYANSHEFVGEYRGTRHSVSCSVIAGDDKGMQRDYWYSVARNANDLEDIESIGAMARERTVRRLGGRGLKTCSLPILFDPTLARSLVGHLFSAISGGALYREASFLLDSINKKILPDWLSITEDPHMMAGLGSVPFDGEGVRTQSRHVVQDGVLQGYVLGSYSARKLGMQTTGNAGGVHNIRMTDSGKTQQELLKDMGKGLLVTELIGHGVNTVTGDYSRGASGFWVENGEIQYPVEEITVAGNLEDMFMNIAAIGNDIDGRGNIQCGSILIENMTIAGSS